MQWPFDLARASHQRRVTEEGTIEERPRSEGLKCHRQVRSIALWKRDPLHSSAKRTLLGNANTFFIIIIIIIFIMKHWKTVAKIKKKNEVKKIQIFSGCKLRLIDDDDDDDFGQGKKLL